MTGAPPSGTQVERVLEDLIARLTRSEASKEVRAALIEARRLRSVTLTWTAIPPPPDARREMLTKVMDLVARVGAGAAPRSSADVRAEAFATLAPLPWAPGDSPPPPRKPPTMPPPPSAPGARRDLKAPSAPPPPAEDAPPASMRRQMPSERPRSLERDRSAALDEVNLDLGPLPLPPPIPLPMAFPAPSGVAASEVRQRLNTPVVDGRSSPIPFRRAPSVQELPAARGPGGITAIGHEAAGMRGVGEKPRRAFGSGNGTQTNLSRPLRTSVSVGVSLVRPQATAWQAYPRVPGAKLKLLWRDGDTGAYTALLHLAPGTTLPARRHAAVEEMLLVEGSALIGSWDIRPGEYCRAEAGSLHEPIRSEEGCTFFVTGSERDEIVEDAGT